MDHQNRAARKKHHVIYKTTCLITGRYYIGMHSTDNLDDGYKGSGKRLWQSIKRHGLEQHQCEIIEHLPSREALRAREAELITEDLIDDPLCMNIALGGGGGWEHVNASLTDEQRTKAGLAGGLIKLTAEQRHEYAKLGGVAARTAWNQKVKDGIIPHQSLGYVHTDESKAKIGATRNKPGRKPQPPMTQEQKDKIRASVLRRLANGS